MSESQVPQIKLNNGRIFAITRYIFTTDNKCKALEKFDVTDQLRECLQKLYDDAIADAKKNRLTSSRQIICLCGSTRFREEYRQLNANFTNQGHIVLSCGVFKGDPEEGMAEKGALDELHKEKIRLADVVFIIDKDGYIGESTQSEIAFAIELGKQIQYLEQTEKNILVP